MPAPAAARSEPSASRPLPAAPSSIPARRALTAPAARRRPGPSFSSCAVPWAPSVESGPHPGLGGDPLLPATQGREILAIGDRALFGGGDEDERRLPAGADRSVDRLGALPRLVGARQLVDPRGAGGEAEQRQDQEQQRHGDEAGGERGVAQRRPGRGGDGRPSPRTRRRPDPPGVDPRPEQAQQGGNGDGRDHDADHGHHSGRGGQREQQRAGLQEGGVDEGDDQGHAGEERRAPGAGPGPRRRHPGVRIPLQLLAEAGDDQQRVVDPESQAHHRADDEGESVDRHRSREQSEDAAPGEDGEGAEGERDRRRYDRAEDEQQNQDQQRRRQQLGPLGRAERFLLQGAGDGGEPRLGGNDRRTNAGLQGVFQFGDDVAHRLVQRYVEVD